MPVKQYRITSRGHELNTIEEWKENLRLFDDKKFITDDREDYGDGEMYAVKCRSLGHWRNDFELEQ